MALPFSFCKNRLNRVGLLIEAHPVALDYEFADAVEKCDTQFLVQVFIECAFKNGFLDKQRFIECEDQFLCILIAALGLNQQLLKIHDYSPRNSFRSF